ncbi:MAG TPA: extracellular solute-binding protein [Roseiflexaceae bacterium]|jgi:multiple sugar transport system substrate-binding protein|nr:extracellular solute-binding protein [Roseiflexaceae bacterium]
MNEDTPSRRVSRRAFLHALGAVGGAALLQACGSPSAGTSTNSSTSTNNAASEAATSAPASEAATSAPAAGAAATSEPAAGAATSAPAQASSGGQEISLLWSDTTNVHAPLVDAFTKQTGIKVNQTIVEYNERLNKITTAVQGGGGFDVVQMDTIWTAQFAQAGWVDDLTGRITDAITSDVPKSSLSAVTYEGKLWGMPLFNSAKHLFYNEKLLKDAGISAPPTTLDEFVTQAKATTKEGQWGSVWSWKQAESLICDWICIMFTNPNAKILDDSGKAVFNTQGGTEALQWMVDLLYTHKVADPASLEYTEDDVKKALFTGKYAITYNWEGVLPDGNDPAKSQAAPNIKVALLPGSKDVKSSSVNGSEGWAILANSQKKDAAWQLLQYMASPAWQKQSAIISGDYPILSSLYSDPELQKNVQDFAIYGEQFKYLAVRPQVPGYAQKSDIIQLHLHEALLNKTSPKDAMDAAADEVNKASSAP